MTMMRKGLSVFLSVTLLLGMSLPIGSLAEVATCTELHAEDSEESEVVQEPLVTLCPTDENVPEPAVTPCPTPEVPLPAFIPGYGRFAADTPVYGGKNGQNRLGKLTEAGYAYVRGSYPASDGGEAWLKIVFASRNEAGEYILREGYVRADAVVMVTQGQEAGKVAEWLAAEHVLLGDDRPLPLTSFEEKVMPTEVPAEPETATEPTDAPIEADPTAAPAESPVEAETTAEPADVFSETESTAEPTEAPVEAAPTAVPTDVPVEAEPTASPAEEEPSAPQEPALPPLPEEILLEARWHGDTLGIGDQVTLTALEADAFVIIWQYMDDQGVWADVGAEGSEYAFELTEVNYCWQWRAVAVGYRTPTDAPLATATEMEEAAQ